MEPIDPQALAKQLAALQGETVFLHLETTRGAYTKGAYGAFARNISVRYHRSGVGGKGPYRVGLQIEGGWIVAEGLTHWRRTPQGRLLMAGHDEEGRLTVALHIGRMPFPMSSDVQEYA